MIKVRKEDILLLLPNIIFGIQILLLLIPPGIRSLDISSFNPTEIQDYFPEFENWKDKCKYGDCLHFNEPYDSCIVKQGVSSGLISIDRYESYLRIMSDVLGVKDYSEILDSVNPENSKKLKR